MRYVSIFDRQKTILGKILHYFRWDKEKEKAEKFQRIGGMFEGVYRFLGWWNENNVPTPCEIKSELVKAFDLLPYMIIYVIVNMLRYD